MAGDGVSFVAVLLQGRFNALANIHDIGTSRIELATSWRVQQIRGRAWYRCQTHFFALDAGECFDQSLSIGMLRILEDCHSATVLYDSSRVHDRYFLTGLCND